MDIQFIIKSLLSEYRYDSKSELVDDTIESIKSEYPLTDIELDFVIDEIKERCSNLIL